MKDEDSDFQFAKIVCTNFIKGETRKCEGVHTPLLCLYHLYLIHCDDSNIPEWAPFTLKQFKRYVTRHWPTIKTEQGLFLEDAEPTARHCCFSPDMCRK